VELDDSSTGASNRRKLSYVKADEDTDYTDARKALQVLERDLGVELELEAEEFSFMRNGRSAAVILDGDRIGFIGEYSGEVCENWDIGRKITGFELDVSKILELQ